MLFSEIYGAYYETVAAILSEAVRGTLTAERITETVRKNAFSESSTSIPRKLRDGTWPLLTDDMRTPLRHPPAQPLTLLQKRWLKTLLLDPRIKLFDIDVSGLEDTEPLFSPRMFVYFDRALDGDPYDSAAYISVFRTVLDAVKNKRRLDITYTGTRGKPASLTVCPLRLEYSQADDKFRLLIGKGESGINVLNLARIQKAVPLGTFAHDETDRAVPYCGSVTFELTDMRGALERVMLMFSCYMKETVRLDDKHYRVSLRYRKEDEPEVLIRLLSAGPYIRVTSPEALIRQMRERLSRQLCMNAV